MTYELDPATGLIKLPGGYVWQLEKNKVSISTVVPVGEFERCDHPWCTNEQQVLEYPATRYEREGWWIFKRHRTYDTTELVMACRSRESYRAVVSVSTKKTGGYHFESSYMTWPMYHEYPNRETLTRENTDKYTEKCYRKFLTHLDEKEAAKIYGVYPPKKLEEI